MATRIHSQTQSKKALVAAFNQLKAYVVANVRNANADLVSIAADSVAFATPTVLDQGAHNDAGELTIASADASDLATSLTLLNELKSFYAFHMADTLAHKVAGVALASYAPVHVLGDLGAGAQATALASACTDANDIKTKYGTHRTSTTYHYVADGTNTISAANASDQGTLNTLLNELKTDLAAHMASAPSACKSLRLAAQ